MNRLRRISIGLGLVAVLVAGACAVSGPTSSPSSSPRIGGTLRIGVSGAQEQLATFAYVDPVTGAGPFAYLMKCCLARTLLSYPGRATGDGGTILQPDLAEGQPTISRDGVSWTFRMRRGIHYAPPYDGVEVTAPDIIRAAERHARLEPSLADPGLPYGNVAGAAEYTAGTAPTISGLSSPDPYTLVIRLTQGYGAFGVFLADIAWAPIPEALASGHDQDLARFWPSTGPYMFEPYPAVEAPESIALVRNPSWDRSTDPRRGAWVDRIELSSVGDPLDGFPKVESGEFDFVDRPIPGELIGRYRGDPSLSTRLRSTSDEGLFWIPMNLAVPPFDDVAVRRAVNWIVDRAAIRDHLRAARTADPARGPQPEGTVVGHVFPDSLTDGLLLTYAPFATQGNHGDVARARAEMSASRYDSDGDGRCDAAACSGMRLPAENIPAGEALRDDLAKIGIVAEVVEATEQNTIGVPTNRAAIQLNLFGWGYNLTGSDLAVLLRGGPQIVGADGTTINQSLVGASAEQLAGWGYQVTSVPSVDDLIDRCDGEIGHLRARCWAELDQYVTSELVPWVPLWSFQNDYLSSARVADYSLDQALVGGWIALDRVSLRPDAAP